MDCLRSCHSSSIRFKSGLWFGHSKILILFFLSHSEVDLLVCLGSLSCCITPSALEVTNLMAGHSPSGFSDRVQNSWFHQLWQVIQVLKLQRARAPQSWYWGWRERCTFTPPTYNSCRTWVSNSQPLDYESDSLTIRPRLPQTWLFDCWYDVLFMKCCVGFTPDVTGHTPPKMFNFCLISPQNICPKVLGIIKIFFGKCETSLCVVSSGFCLGTLSWMPFLPSLFLIVESQTLTLIEASEVCSSLNVVLGSFMTSWISRHCTLAVILVGQPLLGRFTTVPSFLHLWIMALTVVCCVPKP